MTTIDRARYFTQSQTLARLEARNSHRVAVLESRLWARQEAGAVARAWRNGLARLGLGDDYRRTVSHAAAALSDARKELDGIREERRKLESDAAMAGLPITADMQRRKSTMTVATPYMKRGTPSDLEAQSSDARHFYISAWSERHL